MAKTKAEKALFSRGKAKKIAVVAVIVAALAVLTVLAVDFIGLRIQESRNTDIRAAFSQAVDTHYVILPEVVYNGAGKLLLYSFTNNTDSPARARRWGSDTNPRTAEDVGGLLFVTRTREEFGTWYSGGSEGRTRYIYHYDVRIVDPYTGYTVGSNRFSGSGSRNRDGFPNRSEVRDWIDTVWRGYLAGVENAEEN
jgi:hypothetical protein